MLQSGTSIEILRDYLSLDSINDIYMYMSIQYRAWSDDFRLHVEHRRLYGENVEKIIVKWCNFEKKCHSLYNVPSMSIYNDDGIIEFCIWHKHGRVHRNGDKPAVIEYGIYGTLLSEEWIKNGQFYRSFDSPALIWYYSNGKFRMRKWFIKDKGPRLNDQPSLIFYYENGQIQDEWWLEDDKFHRIDKPCEIGYYKNGKIREEQWKQHDVHYREGGKPTCINYDLGGNIFQ